MLNMLVGTLSLIKHQEEIWWTLFKRTYFIV